MRSPSLLLVEDEAGIREGLQSFLQLKGCRVVVAASLAEGLSQLEHGDFDVVVTDWHLGDGLGAEILGATTGPVLVMSGVTESVVLDEMQRQRVRLLRKPTMPAELLAEIERMAAGAPDGDAAVAGWPNQVPNRAEGVVGLPVDTRDRLHLLVSLSRTTAELRLHDDGVFVTATLPVDADCVEDMSPHIERLGGDFRILDGEGGARLEYRCYRDGRSDAVDLVLPPSAVWPDSQMGLAVDFDGEDCSPEHFLRLLAAASSRTAAGWSVEFLNVPGHLRLHAEVWGKAHDMPKRSEVGPRLPEVLSELWS